MDKPPKLTKQNLIQSGEALFLKKGFHAVSIRDLAEKAKTNVASIHYHFGDKYKLYEAVLQKHFDDFNARLQKGGFDHKSPKERLLLINQVMQGLLSKQSDFCRTIYQSLLCGDTELKKSTRSILKKNIKSVHAQLRQASKACRWKKLSAKISPDSFIFLIMSINPYWALFAQDFHIFFGKSPARLIKEAFQSAEVLLENLVEEL